MLITNSFTTSLILCSNIFQFFFFSFWTSTWIFIRHNLHLFLPSIVFEYWNTSLFLIITFSCIKSEIFLKITEVYPFHCHRIISGVSNDLASWNLKSKLFCFLGSKPLSIVQTFSYIINVTYIINIIIFIPKYELKWYATRLWPNKLWKKYKFLTDYNRLVYLINFLA